MAPKSQLTTTKPQVNAGGPVGIEPTARGSKGRRLPSHAVTGWTSGDRFDWSGALWRVGVHQRVQGRAGDRVSTALAVEAA